MYVETSFVYDEAFAAVVLLSYERGNYCMHFFLAACAFPAFSRTEKKYLPYYSKSPKDDVGSN